MANQLHTYRDARGLTNEQVAEELSALLGKPISANSVALWGRKSKPPKAWAAALNLPDEEPADQDGPFVEIPMADLGVSQRAEGEPPAPPPGAKVSSPPAARGGDYSIVRDRIAKAYSAIGAGASMITHNDGFGAVADSYAPDIAAAWVAAAQENKNVAKIVAFMESGGPVGELVVAHVILVLGFAYVSGKGPALDFLYAGKFGGHRAAALHVARLAEYEQAGSPDLNGSAPLGAEGAVGHAAS